MRKCESKYWIGGEDVGNWVIKSWNWILKVINWSREIKFGKRKIKEEIWSRNCEIRYEK